MFSKVLVQGESVTLPSQPKQDRLQVVVHITETKTPGIAFYAIGLDADGWVVEDACITMESSSSFPSSTAVMEWLEPSSRDPEGFRTLSLHLAGMPESVSCIWLIMGLATSPFSIETASLHDWAKGSIRVRAGIQSWEWMFLGPRLPPQTKGMKTLSLRRQHGHWTLKVGGECLKQSVQAWVKQCTERPQFKDVVEDKQLGEKRSHSPLFTVMSPLSSNEPVCPEWLQAEYKQAEIIRRERGLLKEGTRYVLVFDSMVIQSADCFAQFKTVLAQLLALSMNTQGVNGVELIWTTGQQTESAGLCTMETYEASLERCRGMASNAASNSPLKNQPLKSFGRMVESVRRQLYPQQGGKEAQAACQNAQPILVTCLVTHDAEDAVMAEWQLRWASYEPLFWHFMVLLPQSTASLRSSKLISRQGGLGGDFKFIDRLPQIPDRLIQNTAYSSLGMLGTCASALFYSALLEDYSEWVKEAMFRQMIRKY